MEELSLILALSALKKAQELGKVLSPKKVDSLPPVGEEGILYFVPKLNPSTMDACDEYIWDSDRSSYELVGSTDMDSDIVKRIENLEDEVSDVPHSEEVMDYTDVEPPMVDADILGGRITADDVEELQDYAAETRAIADDNTDSVTELKQDLTQLSANVSDAYSSSKTYYNGDLVIYSNELWKYDKVGASGTSAVPSDSVASKTSVGNELKYETTTIDIISSTNYGISDYIVKNIIGMTKAVFTITANNVAQNTNWVPIGQIANYKNEAFIMSSLSFDKTISQQTTVLEVYINNQGLVQARGGTNGCRYRLYL